MIDCPCTPESLSIIMGDGTLDDLLAHVCNWGGDVGTRANKSTGGSAEAVCTVGLSFPASGHVRSSRWQLRSPRRWYFPRPEFLSRPLCQRQSCPAATRALQLRATQLVGQVKPGVHRELLIHQTPWTLVDLALHPLYCQVLAAASPDFPSTPRCWTRTQMPSPSTWSEC